MEQSQLILISHKLAKPQVEDQLLTLIPLPRMEVNHQPPMLSKQPHQERQLPMPTKLLQVEVLHH